MGIHEMAAMALKAKELELTVDEATKLGVAVARVADIYNIRMTPTQEAWGMLIKTTANIYYPRIVAIRRRTKEEKLAPVEVA